MIAVYELGRWLRAMCRNGVGRSLSVSTLWSADTPTISNSGPSGPRVSEGLADRALAGPVAAGERLVDDGDARRVGAIGVGKRAALDDRHAHRLEVLGRHDRRFDRVAVVVRLMPIGHPDLPAVRVHLQRHARRQRRRLDAGNRRHARDRLLVELAAALVRIPQHPGVGRHDRELVDREAGARALRGDEAARQQRGDDEQQRGHRHLPGDERVAQRPAAAPRRASTLVSPRRSAMTLGLDACIAGTSPASRPASSAGAEREREDARVDVKIEGERNRQRQAQRRGRRRQPPGDAACRRPRRASESRIDSVTS